jgi:hypothetical protein
MNKLILALGATVLLSGCATVSKSKDHHIMFTSTPTNVLAVFSDDVSCYTPCSRRLKRTQDVDVTFAYKNETREVSLKSGLQKDTARNLAGNVLFFGWVGMFFDIMSGKNLGPDTNHVHVEF